MREWLREKCWPSLIVKSLREYQHISFLHLIHTHNTVGWNTIVVSYFFRYAYESHVLCLDWSFLLIKLFKMDSLAPRLRYIRPGWNLIPVKTRMSHRPLELRLQNKFIYLLLRLNPDNWHYGISLIYISSLMDFHQTHIQNICLGVEDSCRWDPN